MKKILLTIIATVLSVSTTSAQDYYTKDQVSGTGFTYNVIRKSADDITFQLVNTTNKYYDKQIVMKDGSYPPEDYDYGGYMKVEYKRKEIEIFKEVFTKEQIANLSTTDESFFIIYTTDSYGKIIEMMFSVSASPKILAIPPAKFYELETKIKARLKFEIGEQAQQEIAFAHFGGIIHFNRLDEPILDWNDM